MSATIDTIEHEAEIVRLVESQVQVTLPAYFFWKPILDRGLALLLLVPCLPIICILVVLVRMTSKGPGIFRQTRVGKNGRTYLMYKIRSMSIDAESGTGAVWTQKNDPRITRIGGILRRMHLDEFPQLFNVLKGEMSLIGPRPERPEFVVVLSRAVPGYMDRLAVLPGISGLAQINLPPDTDLDSVRRKQMLDVRYIDEASLWLDLRMMLWTCSRLLGVDSEFAIRALRLDRRVELEDLGGSSSTLENQPATPDFVAQQAQIGSVTTRTRPQNHTKERGDQSARTSAGNSSPHATPTAACFMSRTAPRYPK